MQLPTRRHWLLLGYLVITWGLAFYLIAIALTAFHPVTIVWGRLTLGAVVMLALLGRRGGHLPRGWLWWRWLLVLSLTGNVVPFVLVAWAERSVPSSEVGLLMALMPIMVLLMGHYFLDHERMTVLKISGVLLGFSGVALLLGENLFSHIDGVRLTGQLAAVVATACYAVNGIFTKRLPAFDTVSVSAGSLLVGSAILVWPMWRLQAWAPPAEFPGAWIAVGVLGIFATGVATWAYFTVVSEVGPGFLSTINYMIPGVAFTVGVLLLGEPAGGIQLFALGLILAGVWLIQPRAAKALS